MRKPGRLKLAPVGTPFEVAYDPKGLNSADEYCPATAAAPQRATSQRRHPNEPRRPRREHLLPPRRARDEQPGHLQASTPPFTTKAKPTMKPSSDFVIETKAATLKWNAYDSLAGDAGGSSPTIKYEVEVRSAVEDEFTDNPKAEVRSDANPPLTWDTGTRLFAGRQYFAKVRAFYPVTGLDASTGTEYDVDSGQYGIWSGFSDEVAFTTEEDAPDAPQAPSYEDDLSDTYRKTRSTQLWTELGYNGGAEVKVVTLIRDENYADYSTTLNFDCPGESGCDNAKMTNGASCYGGAQSRKSGSSGCGSYGSPAVDTWTCTRTTVGGKTRLTLIDNRGLVPGATYTYNARATNDVGFSESEGSYMTREAQAECACDEITGCTWKPKHGMRTWRSVGQRGHVQRDSRPARGADVRRGDHVVDHGEVDCARVRQRGGLGKVYDYPFLSDKIYNYRVTPYEDGTPMTPVETSDGDVRELEVTASSPARTTFTIEAYNGEKRGRNAKCCVGRSDCRPTAHRRVQRRGRWLE